MIMERTIDDIRNSVIGSLEHMERTYNSEKHTALRGYNLGVLIGLKIALLQFDYNVEISYRENGDIEMIAGDINA